MVVEYLVDKYGLDVMRRILTDLGVGMPINDALGRYTGGTQGLDREFAAYAKQRAEQFADELDWDRKGIPADPTPTQVHQLLADNPNNYWLQLAAARFAIQAGDWSTARDVLEQVYDVYPGDIAEDGAARLLASVYRQLDETDAEQRVLEVLARQDSDALDAYRRLIDLAKADSDWQRVQTYAQQMIAVNPMISAAQEELAAAAQHLNDPRAQIDAQIALLETDLSDPAEAYYQLATAHQRLGDLVLAKRYVLMALEEAPRYRAAQQLLLSLIQPSLTDRAVADEEIEKDEIAPAEQGESAADDAAVDISAESDVDTPEPRN